MQFPRWFSLKKIWSRLVRRWEVHHDFSQWRTILQKNRTLFNTQPGGTCFILGNGPSLNNCDLTRLAEKETFVMNGFWLHRQYGLIRPKYYLVMDVPKYADTAQPLDLHEDLPGRDPIVSAVPETKLFFSTTGQEFIEKNKLFRQNPIHYILQRGLMDGQLRFNIDPTKAMPFTKNTLIMAILLAVYMGFETIYLLGCEHDYLAYPKNKSLIDFKHFFEEPARPIPAAHFRASYEDIIKSTLRLFQNYRYLREKLTRDYPRVKIYNTTPNSFLDVFPFVNFDEIS